MVTAPLFESRFASRDEVFELWNPADDKRNSPQNIEVNEGIMSLWTRVVDGEWQGASIVWPHARTYGRFVARVKVDVAKYTKALLLLWPEGDWPPEIDFMELGGTENYDRQKNTMAVHFGFEPFHPVVHRSYAADMTQWHTVAVNWRRDYITFTLDGKVMQNVWGKTDTRVVNPGVHVPMKFHLTYWPHHNDDSDPWPLTESRMQVEWVKVYA